MILVGVQERWDGKVLTVPLDVPQLSMLRARPAIFHLQTGLSPVLLRDSTVQPRPHN